MGALLTSRQNAAVEEAEQSSSHAYKYPPRSGNFFGSHFIMGGERFDTPQPESYLFGENVDLNFLGTRPTAFPYPPPQANEPTKTLKSLVNIRKESVRFVRVPADKHLKKHDSIDGTSTEQVDGNVLGMIGGGGGGDAAPTCTYNIEFTFDADAKCAITIYYFCSEDVSPSGVTLTPRDGLTSETYHYAKGINQSFSQPGHVFNPQLIPEDDLIYNATKEQYPVAIHCVIEEGNECRQSHTTICVIDHHPESCSYVLRALKQKMFVDGLCYLLQEIYGIENKAVNKSSIDEDIDDHGSECVICMSETRDTLILPCRHLCLCNSCADSLRYQANNCPICRAPFRALLQIRAVQKGISGSHVLHQNTTTSSASEPTPPPCDQHMPPGYVPVSLIEALNGPTQYVTRARPSEGDVGDGVTIIDSHKATSPSTVQNNKSNSQRRSKIKKNASTCTNACNEVGTTTPTTTVSTTTTATHPNATLSVVEITNEKNLNTSAQKSSPTSEKKEKPSLRSSQDKLQIINERHSLKKTKSITKRNANNSSSSRIELEDDDDSENENLSPLLTPSSKSGGGGSNNIKLPNATQQQSNEEAATLDTDDGENEDDNGEGIDEVTNVTIKKHKRPDLSNSHHAISNSTTAGGATGNAEDSDYYTPEDTQNSILSPLCPDSRAQTKSGISKVNAAGSLKSVSGLAKKNLHKKSTSVGNIAGTAGNGAAGDLKGNVSSLPDMLDSPIGGNSASTRSSSDSYSSSSSTKQLLSSNPITATVANIIVDDKVALQNAVNV